MRQVDLCVFSLPPVSSGIDQTHPRRDEDRASGHRQLHIANETEQSQHETAARRIASEDDAIRVDWFVSCVRRRADEV